MSGNLPGSSPSWIQGIQSVDGEAREIRREFAVKGIEERTETDIPLFTQKANKVPRQGTYTVYVGHWRPLE